MMQAIGETIFDVLYLGGVLTLGLIMLCKAKKTVVRKYGLMAVLLGAGDAFHLVPRAWALCTTGLEAHAAALGVGKFITSITMTAFYLLLYYIWREHYGIQGKKGLTAAMWVLTACRIGLCLLPQNDWLNYRQPLFYGILRNIPFAIIGIIIVCLFAQTGRKNKNDEFRFMPLAVILSFGFYLPVVLFSGVVPAVGALMIPKTLAYVWVVFMGWKLFKKQA